MWMMIEMMIENIGIVGVTADIGMMLERDNVEMTIQINIIVSLSNNKTKLHHHPTTTYKGDAKQQEDEKKQKWINCDVIDGFLR